MKFKKKTLNKTKPFRDKKYLSWIKSLPCCATGATDCIDAHHITGSGQGGMGTKPGDNYCIPLTREMHTLLHHNPARWEDAYGLQSIYLAEIIEQARFEKRLPAFECFVTGLE